MANKIKRKIVIVVLLSFVVSLFYVELIISQQKKQGNKQSQTTFQDNLKQNSGSKKNPQDLLIMNSEGYITIGVRYLNPLEDDKDNLVFELFLDNHQVDLSTLNFNGKILFTTSEAIKVKNVKWWIEDSGHHVTAFIKIPKNSNGKKLITSNTKYIQLELCNIGGAKSRIYRWNSKFFN